MIKATCLSGRVYGKTIRQSNSLLGVSSRRSFASYIFEVEEDAYHSRFFLSSSQVLSHAVKTLF